MKQPKKKPIRLRRLITGYALLTAGLLGLFLPLFQGIILILAAIIVLKDHSVWAHGIFYVFRDRFPRYKKFSTRFESKIDEFFTKIGLG